MSNITLFIHADRRNYYIGRTAERILKEAGPDLRAAKDLLETEACRGAAVGDFVKAWWDTGAMGCTPMYGIIRKAGPKTVTVEWRSGTRNRVRRTPGSGFGLCFGLDADDLECARDSWERAAKRA